MTDLLYRVRWRSRITGQTGGGEGLLTRQCAAEWVRAMNREWPQIEHWIEPERDDLIN